MVKFSDILFMRSKHNGNNTFVLYPIFFSLNILPKPLACRTHYSAILTRMGS